MLRAGRGPADFCAAVVVVVAVLVDGAEVDGAVEVVDACEVGSAASVEAGLEVVDGLARCRRGRCLGSGIEREEWCT